MVMGVSMSMGGVWWVLSQLFLQTIQPYWQSAEQLQCLVSEFGRVCKWES